MVVLINHINCQWASQSVLYYMLHEPIWAIPCHVCHNTGSIFFFLKYCKIPLLILNSSKHPTRFCSGCLSTFCTTVLTFISAVALHRCVEKARHVTTLYHFLEQKCNSEEIIPKKQHHLCHIFCNMCYNLHF